LTSSADQGRPRKQQLSWQLKKNLEKYTLIEVADYFDDDLLLPRIKKSVYASEWDSGKPTKKNELSHMIKYHKIEDYEGLFE